MVTIVNLQKATHKEKRLLKTPINVKRTPSVTKLDLPEVSIEHNIESSKGILLKQISLIIGHNSYWIAPKDWPCDDQLQIETVQKE